MQMTKSDVDPTQDSVSSSIWLASFGIQRDRQLESAVVVAEFVPSHGNFMRIPIQTQDDGSDLPICMEITCQPFRTLNALSLSLASSPTVVVIMLLESLWQWESCQLDMSRQMRILLTC